MKLPIAMALLLVMAPAIAQEPTDDPCAPRGAPIPPPPASAPVEPPPEVPYVPLRGMGTEVDLGIGHLHATEAQGAEWFRAVEAPVYDMPGGAPIGWIHLGWWIPSGDRPRPVPLTTESMVETGYEVASWIVSETRLDGWVRFRFAPDAGGVGWASRCHLSASDPAVAYSSWESRFAEQGAVLYFRAGERHALRRGPGTRHPRSFWLVGGDATQLEPLEVRGDWMRVRATSPPLHCTDPLPTRALVEEGWIRWRDAESGPWVWWHTRGC